MNDKYYITITHIDEYAGNTAVRPGMKLILKKDHDNCYDDEAIQVNSQNGCKYGYVANSVHTVCRGTHSAGYMYRLIGETGECIVRFCTEEFAIAEVIFSL